MPHRTKSAFPWAPWTSSFSRGSVGAAGGPAPGLGRLHGLALGGEEGPSSIHPEFGGPGVASRASSSPKLECGARGWTPCLDVQARLRSMALAWTFSFWKSRGPTETRSKSCPNLGSEIRATKRGTLLVLVLLCSMGWGSTHVFQPKIIDST